MALLENSTKGLAIRMNQAEDRVSGFEDKIEDLDQISEEHEKNPRKGTHKIHKEPIGHFKKKTSFSIIGINKGKNSKSMVWNGFPTRS